MTSNCIEMRLYLHSVGWIDGKLDDARYMYCQLLGRCTEDRNIIYRCDAQTGSVKPVTCLCGAADFLSEVGNLYDVSGVHKKHAKNRERYTLYRCCC